MAKSSAIFHELNIKISDTLTGRVALSPESLQDLYVKQVLLLSSPSGTITPSACKQIMDFIEKERRVKEVCDLSRIKVRPDDGRVYILINRKTFSGTSYIGLIEKLYDHFFGIENISLEGFFEIWMKWRIDETSTSSKTIKEDQFMWNTFLKGNDITIIPLKTLTALDFIRYFRSITKDRTLTRKRFNNLKSILNGMLYLAIEYQIIDHNCLRDINYKNFAYKAENVDVFPYTEDERIKIINHLGNDLYSLAIKLDFYLIIRIGELKGLKWTDINGDFIHIQRYVNQKNEIIEDIKGHQAAGKRFMPLVPAAKEILEQVRLLNPHSEYIFIQDGKTLTTSTFNRRLQKCCIDLGIKYRSSHKVRFSTASIMHKNGVSDTEMSQLLGHTTLNMTRHYFRNITPERETTEKMRAILG